MSGEVNLRGIGHEWLRLFASSDDAPRRLALALGIGYPPAERDLPALAVAGDMGLVAADIVGLPPVSRQAEDPIEQARQWRIAERGECSIPALIVPVSMDSARPAFAPGQLTLSMSALGAWLFAECICDMVAIPLNGSRPLSLTGLSLAVGRFAVRERGELRIFASGMTWIREHLDRARQAGGEMPARLVAQTMDPPDHFSTLVIEPAAIEWRPHIAWCAMPTSTKSIVVADSLGLANMIDGLMRRKEKLPPMPTVMGPRSAA